MFLEKISASATDEITSICKIRNIEIAVGLYNFDFILTDYESKINHFSDSLAKLQFHLNFEYY